MNSRFASLTLALVLSMAPALPLLATSANQPAPAFELPSREGPQVNLSQYKGKVVMLNFWASWCGPCRQEMPLLDSIYRKYNKLGFVLLGVNVEPDSKAANDWLKQTPVTFPVLYDKESKVSQLYNVSGMPTTVFIDRKGNVRMIHVSYKPGDESEYLNSVTSLIRE